VTHPRTLSTALLLASFALLAGPGSASAQESAGGATLLTYLEDGGPVMYVILFLSLVGTVIFLERMFGLYVVRRLAARSLTERVVEAVEATVLPQGPRPVPGPQQPSAAGRVPRRDPPRRPP
jgi:hypothetical protein